MFKNIIFFNHWHYGDLFTTRELVRDIQRQLPNYRYGYAHTLSPLVLKDYELINLSPEKITQVLQNIEQKTRFAQSDDTIFINTWVGAYYGMWEGVHPTYIDHYSIFKAIYGLLNQHFNLNLTIKDSFWDYIPEVDYSKVETSRIHEFIDNEVRGKIHLICNNQVMSLQSEMGFMENITEILARCYPDDMFIATHAFPTALPNIKFTYDIFKMSNDLLEISYLSKFVNGVIVGKNSGPYTYTHTKANILNPSKHYVCFSKNETDTLNHGLDCPAKFAFSNTLNDIDAAYLINQSIKQSKEII